jgi:small subunit ribosomal protein S9
MTEEPQRPEDEAPEGAPGEPGEATPSETAPEGAEQAIPEAPDESPAGDGDGEEHPGPEIEGIEELAQAAEAGQPEEAAEGEPAEEAAEGEPAEEAAEGEPAEEAAEGEAAEGEAAEEAPRAERPRPGARRKDADKGGADEVIPGAHLEPDLVLEEQRPTEGEFGEYGEYAETEAGEQVGEAAAEEATPEEQPVAHTPLDLAADARYRATGKRKSSVARVTLKPGEGTYTINGRHLDEYFPRVLLQRMARQPLEATGNQARMDVVALIHGGGVSAQATALRHGIARALVEADPALRGELKRRGYLTRDPRVKERKKAGLKKARKRPQFSKR